MAASSVCSICGETDSWRHSLIECNMSRCIWALAPESLWEHMERTSEPDAKQWIFTMIDSLPHEELTRCFVTLWAIWYARRKVLHEDRYQSPLSTHAFIDSFLHDLKISTPSREITRGAGAPAPTKRWLPPPVDHAKINVDAAVAKQVCAGAITAVCRDMDGRFLGASAQVIAGINDPGTLETLACREALSLAEDLQLAHLRVASDCLEVIMALMGDNLGRFALVLQEIKRCYPRFASVEFVHEGRASNMEAHTLARASTSRQEGRYIWLVESPDPHCIPHLLAH
ncbi:uncharacterized protein LOC104583970 [Brachypodium distachyon]|uniref:uncharacterized protein LOC104583970 n=1 Tax=Brachypodium distachyon TaxID=15368 RepID=UPI00052FDF17|nr:uncharacterized protein LOC104583970 [Brachypodium distachyon]|eukprot:XP_010236322.1 uncharacterized protein LOC104583970 [Brachypodium distachyon]